MLDTSTLVWGMIFGAIGLGFFTYGKKRRSVVPLLVGLALFVFPYFVTNVFALVGIGVVLVALPFFLKI